MNMNVFPMILPSSKIGLTFESTIVLSWSLRADGTKSDGPRRDPTGDPPVN